MHAIGGNGAFKRVLKGTFRIGACVRWFSEGLKEVGLGFGLDAVRKPG